MDVDTVSNRNLSMVDASTGVVEAAARMRAEHVGDLIVVEHRAGRRVPIGILTDRDITVAIVATWSRRDGSARNGVARARTAPYR